jgi:hypothetical protein
MKYNKICQCYPKIINIGFEIERSVEIPDPKTSEMLFVYIYDVNRGSTTDLSMLQESLEELSNLPETYNRIEIKNRMNLKKKIRDEIHTMEQIDVISSRLIGQFKD